MSGMELMARVEALSARLDEAADPLADEAVSALMDLYGAGLERICMLVDPHLLARDKFLSSLLLIHDLHPVPLEDRVRNALERVRPYMESHGGDVEFLGLRDGVARLRLVGSCSSCSASTSTLELAVEKALEEACPDLEGMEVEGVEPVAGIPLPMMAAPTWFDADVSPAVDGLVAATVAGRSLVVANVAGTLLAYANACASCGSALEGGALTDGVLACPGCARMYVLPRAGRSADDERLQLEPVPLLREEGRVRVALAG